MFVQNLIKLSAGVHELSTLKTVLPSLPRAVAKKAKLRRKDWTAHVIGCIAVNWLSVVCAAVDRCVSLKPPARGVLMCSAASSNDVEDVTTCHLVCPRGLTLPRPADDQLTAAERFHCRRDVGVWTPTERVPSCVGQSVRSLHSLRKKTY